MGFVTSSVLCWAFRVCHGLGLPWAVGLVLLTNFFFFLDFSSKFFFGFFFFFFGLKVGQINFFF